MTTQNGLSLFYFTVQYKYILDTLNDKILYVYVYYIYIEGTIVEIYIIYHSEIHLSILSWRFAILGQYLHDYALQ